MGLQQHPYQRGRRMERCIQDTTRTIQTEGHVLRNVQLPQQLPMFRQQQNHGKGLPEIRINQSQMPQELHGRLRVGHLAQGLTASHRNHPLPLRPPSGTQPTPETVQVNLHATPDGLPGGTHLETWRNHQPSQDRWNC